MDYGRGKAVALLTNEVYVLACCEYGMRVMPRCAPDYLDEHREETITDMVWIFVGRQWWNEKEKTDDYRLIMIKENFGL